LRAAVAELDRLELQVMEDDREQTQLRYAQALADYADAGGYDAEVIFDACCTEALGVSYDRAKWREVSTLSGGEQKRLALEALLRGPDEVLLLDEPDNFLDVPAKRWLEAQLQSTQKSVLLVSHDRELLAQTAKTIAVLELGVAGNTVWIHGSGFATLADARRARFARLEELRRRWDEQHKKASRADTDVQDQGRVQRCHGVALSGGSDPAGQVRRGWAASGGAARTAGVDAPQRRAHRQACSHDRQS
jgi:ATPase subunit of ABC transporter with duplicated ATPase domains